MASHMKSQLTIAVDDVGALVSDAQALRQGLLLRTNSIDHATNEDKRVLRELLGITTIIDTRYPPKVRYYYDPGRSGSYRSETCSVENVLGLTSCHVYLRLGGTFMENLIKELPASSRQKLNLKANTAVNRNDPKLVEYTQSLLPTRKHVDDALAVLEASAGTVAYVYNNIISGPNAFPLLICGDDRIRDTSILLCLLLLFLDVSDSGIERALAETDENSSANASSHAGERHQNEKFVERAAKRDRWTNGLKQRLEAKYGSVAGYLRVAGVTEAAMRSIREALQPPFSEKGPLVDLEPTAAMTS